MPSNQKPPVGQSGLQHPEDEVVWVKCRAKNKCEGNRAKVLLKKQQGVGGTWIQYVCLTCNTPFAIRY